MALERRSGKGYKARLDYEETSKQRQESAIKCSWIDRERGGGRESRKVVTTWPIRARRRVAAAISKPRHESAVKRGTTRGEKKFHHGKVARRWIKDAELKLIGRCIFHEGPKWSPSGVAPPCEKQRRYIYRSSSDGSIAVRWFRFCRAKR